MSNNFKSGRFNHNILFSNFILVAPSRAAVLRKFNYGSVVHWSLILQVELFSNGTEINISSVATIMLTTDAVGK